MTIIDVPVSDIPAAPLLPAEGEIGVVNIGSLTLESGVVLPDVSITVQRWGQLSPAADNVVMVLHALTGDSHVTGPAGPDHPTGGWWDGVAGPGAPIDTDRWCAIATNVLGGCRGSTGPSSLAPDGKPWGSRFPAITVRDQVNADIAALAALGITQVAAVVDAVLVDLTPMPASEALVRRLQAAGQPLYFLSNMPAPFADHLERQYPVLSAFQAGVFSSRVRLSKPDPAIFALAARRFGQAPGELVLLDDSPANVAAAQAAGWRALLFADALQAEAELRAAGWWPAAAP